MYLDGHDLRHCAIEDRKVLLRDVIGGARCERVVYVDHVLGIGNELFGAVRQIGAEGIVSQRRGSHYRGGESREWLKTKCSETGVFAITASANSARAGSMPCMSQKRVLAFYAPQDRSGFSFARGRDACSTSDAGPAKQGIVPVWLGLVADIKCFGRHKGGSIRDGVILSVQTTNDYEKRRSKSDCPPILNPQA